MREAFEPNMAVRLDIAGLPLRAGDPQPVRAKEDSGPKWRVVTRAEDIAEEWLKGVYRLWHAAAGSHRFPRRRDLDPVLFKPYLGNLVLVDIENAPRRYRYRLIGTRVQSWSGNNHTGCYVDDLYDEATVASLTTSFDWMVEHAYVTLAEGRLVMKNGARPPYKSIRLPLSEDGEDIAGIMIALLPDFDC